MTDPTPTPTSPPGSPEALDEGCLCSFLLNTGADAAFVDPLCPLHGAQPEGRASAS